MKKIIFLLIIFAIFSVSYHSFKGKFDLSLQEQGKEMSEYESEDIKFILSDTKNHQMVSFFVKLVHLHESEINSRLVSIDNPPPNYFS